MRLGERINRLRLNRRESLQDVATDVGVSKAHIWELEKGRTNNPALSLVTRLADHFGVTVAYLANEEIDAPDGNADLQRMFRQAHELDPRDRETLDAMLQTFRARTRPAE